MKKLRAGRKPSFALLIALVLPACGENGGRGGGGGNSLAGVTWAQLFCDAAQGIDDWSIQGFSGNDEDRDPADPRVALLRVGQTVTLNVDYLSLECGWRLRSVRWLSSNPAAARLQGSGPSVSLVGVAVGETVVSAAVETASGSIFHARHRFFDGSTITHIRVVAR